jgi:hypothetical protein
MEPSGGDPVLTGWLHEKIQSIAGLGSTDPPLTFAMLWHGDKNAPNGLAQTPEQPAINLEMITTNVTLGRPYRWPTHTGLFYFNQAELRDFFPERVVDWMRARARKPNPNDAEQVRRHEARAARGLFPLPHAGDLPVIAATRMSLAFPVLLSAVPLYAVDYRNPQFDEPGVPKLERCWFSDGGLSSNFPISLFDAPLPRWPTFAINLQGLPPGQEPSKNQAENVYMPRTNAAGRQPVWTRFTGLPGFLGAIINTMQNWRDSTMMPLPGYRDRIVTILMGKKEGGLNLDMPPDVLQSLRERGAIAGAMIAARFDDPGPGLPQPDEPRMNWTNHREQRYLTTMGAVRAYLSKFFRGYREAQSGDVPYEQFVAQHYPLLQHVTGAVAGTGQTLQDETALERHIPRPQPELQVSPQLDS